MSVIIMYTVSD